jgi:hypothetical protein
MREPIAKFLRQSPDDLSSWQDTLSALDALASEMKEIEEALA